MGDTQPHLPVVRARAAHDFQVKPGRAKLIRVVLQQVDGALTAASTGTQSSGVLKSMVVGDGLMFIAPDATEVPAGSEVRVQVYDLSALDREHVDYGFQ